MSPTTRLASQTAINTRIISIISTRFLYIVMERTKM